MIRTVCTVQIWWIPKTTTCTGGKQLLETSQCSVGTVIRIHIHHLIQCICHKSPWWCWMWRDEVVNGCLFALLVTGMLRPDPRHLRLWYVYIATKPRPQTILHAVQYSWEVVWSETELWEHNRRNRDGDTHYTTLHYIFTTTHHRDSLHTKHNLGTNSPRPWNGLEWIFTKHTNYICPPGRSTHQLVWIAGTHSQPSMVSPPPTCAVLLQHSAKRP